MSAIAVPTVISAPESVRTAINEVLTFTRDSQAVVARAPDGRSWTEVLFGKALTASPSSQGARLGEQELPFDFLQATLFQTTNIHHATCIHTKVAATVGLGFKLDTEEKGGKSPKSSPSTLSGASGNALAPADHKQNRLLSKVDEILNPLCMHSWADTLSSVCEDFWQVGNGYLEVVRKNKRITGLYHIPAHRVRIFLEDEKYNFHYTVANEAGGRRRFARFGEKDRLIAAKGTAINLTAGERNNAKTVSEIIHFRRPTSLSRWYGFPDWVSCVSYIELSQCLVQHKYDFFNNRGVPEFMLFVLGQKLSAKDWSTIESAIRANIGSGNSHKSMALNLENENIKIQLEKLAMDNATDEQFSTTGESIALGIVTAHRTPPLLAGIQIPGKLGATNELPNALAGFQALVAGPAQFLFSQTLGSTLGDSGSGLGLKRTDFTFYTMLDEAAASTATLQPLDTQSRMRQPAATATDGKGNKRDLKAGLKK